MAFLVHAESLGDALAGEVGVVAPEADALGAAVLEQLGERGCREFNCVAVPQMCLVTEIANEVAGQISVADANVNLPDKDPIWAAEGTEKGRLAGIRFLVETANGGDGIGLGEDLHRRVVTLMAGEMCAVACRHCHIPGGIVQCVGAQIEALRRKA